MERSRHFVIGDIHGHFRALDALLNRIEPTAADRITFLGDYIDRGPDSKQVLDTLISLGNIARPIAGNHEVLMVAAREDTDVEREWLRYGGAATLRSFGVVRVNEIAGAYFRWMKELPWYIEDDDHVFVHAGVDPQIPMAAQIQQDLLWRHTRGPQRLSTGKTLVCGHTPHAFPVVKNAYVNLDTGIAEGGRLSCIELSTGQIFQSDTRGNTVDFIAAIAA